MAVCCADLAPHGQCIARVHCTLHAARAAGKQLQQQQKQQQQQDTRHQQRQQTGQGSPSESPAVSVATQERYAVYPSFEGQFSGLYPDLQPLPSTLRRVDKLLARHDAAADMQALLLLCPCPTLLLCQYAARSGAAAVEAALCFRKDTSSTANNSSSSDCDCNRHPVAAMPLLQRLMQHVGAGWGDYSYVGNIFGRGLMRSSVIDYRYVDTTRLGCQAALAAGHIPSLLWALPTALHETRRRSSKPLLLTLLLPYAARYSNAACLRAVLLQFSPFDRAAVLAPQHLAMAACRTDPWALGVVQLIMGLLAPKQLKPSHMRAAYRAACASGYPPVLQVRCGAGTHSLCLEPLGGLLSGLLIDSHHVATGAGSVGLALSGLCMACCIVHTGIAPFVGQLFVDVGSRSVCGWCVPTLTPSLPACACCCCCRSWCTMQQGPRSRTCLCWCKLLRTAPTC